MFLVSTDVITRMRETQRERRIEQVHYPKACSCPIEKEPMQNPFKRKNPEPRFSSAPRISMFLSPIEITKMTKAYFRVTTGNSPDTIQVEWINCPVGTLPVIHEKQYEKHL